MSLHFQKSIAFLSYLNTFEKRWHSKFIKCASPVLDVIRAMLLIWVDFKYRIGFSIGLIENVLFKFYLKNIPSQEGKTLCLVNQTLLL